MLTENEEKEHVKQADIRRQTRQPEAFKKTTGKWSKNHPSYMKDYMKDYVREWGIRNKEKQRQYMEIWNKNHPNYLKEWKSSMKGINAGSTLKIEGVDLAVVSETDKSIYREIDETMIKGSSSKQDEW